MSEATAPLDAEPPTAPRPARRATPTRDATDTYLVGLDAAEDHVCQVAEGLIGFLAGVTPAAQGRTQIDRIALLEKLHAATAGALAAEQVAFAEHQRAEQVRAGVSRRNLGRGIPEQIGFARRLSPVAAGHHLSRSYALRDRLPHTLAALRRGDVSDHQTTVLATRTSHLSDADARDLDREVVNQLTGWNITQTRRAADAAAYRLDPHGAVKRRAVAETQRRVTVRPAPDNMAYLTGLLPLEQAVACYAGLTSAADTNTGGDSRGRGQIMADTMVERITGQQHAHHVPVEVQLTIAPDTLHPNTGPAGTPGYLYGYGPIPAPLARDLITNRRPNTTPPGDPSSIQPPETGQPAELSVFHRRIPATGSWYDAEPPPAEPDITDREYRRAQAWLRRVFTDPVTGSITAIDSRRRTFSGTLRRLIAARDQHCRQPYCTAPIRHIDHRQPWRRGGLTTEENGQGLCEQGNYVKDMPGWHTCRGPHPGDITITTPTGHTYTTRPPQATGMPGTTIRGPSRE